MAEENAITEKPKPKKLLEKILVAVMAVIFITSVVFGLLFDLEKIGTFKAVMACFAIGLSGTVLIEKFVFPGWNINTEIQKGPNGSQNAGMVYIAIAIVVSSIISKLF